MSALSCYWLTEPLPVELMSVGALSIYSNEGERQALQLSPHEMLRKDPLKRWEYAYGFYGWIIYTQLRPASSMLFSQCLVVSWRG